MRKLENLRSVHHLARYSGALLLASVLCLTILQFGSAGGGTAAHVVTSEPPQPQPPVAIIDGSKTPERIPDHIAYAMIFRLVADRQSDAEKRSARAYINQLGLGGKKCRSCPKGEGKESEAEPEIDALVEAAEEYHRQVGFLDRQAKAIKDATWRDPSPAAISALADLQRQKETLAKSSVIALEQRLGTNAANRLRQHVEKRVKHRTKLRVKAEARP